MKFHLKFDKFDKNFTYIHKDLRHERVETNIVNACRTLTVLSQEWLHVVALATQSKLTSSLIGIFSLRGALSGFLLN